MAATVVLRSSLILADLISFLEEEWRAYFWVKLELAEVVYLEGSETLEKAFPKMIEGAVEMISDMLN